MLTHVCGGDPAMLRACVCEHVLSGAGGSGERLEHVYRRQGVDLQHTLTAQYFSLLLGSIRSTPAVLAPVTTRTV